MAMAHGNGHSKMCEAFTPCKRRPYKVFGVSRPPGRAEQGWLVGCLKKMSMNHIIYMSKTTVDNES